MIFILEEFRDRDRIVTLEKNTIDFLKYRVKSVTVKSFPTEEQARKEYSALAKPKRKGAKS